MDSDSDSVNYDESEPITKSPSRFYDESESTKSLFKHVIDSNWQEVETIFRQNHEAQGAKIPRLGNTILHMAVSQGKDDVVWQLVRLIPDENVKEVLGAKNERGNTPLHLAAALGMIAMCKCIANKDPTLIGATNKDGETPLFSAVRHGETKAFLCLHGQSPPDAIAGCSYCRRSNGDNILHSAIFGDYFGLANQIIDLYKNLVGWRNEKGQIPLHVLATKSSAFKSGSRLGIYDKIIYHFETHDIEDYKDNSEDKRNFCVTFFLLLMNAIKVLVPGGKNNGNPSDEENPNKVSRGGSPGGPPSISAPHEGESSNATQITSSKHERLTRAQKIKDKKEKHTWAMKIMDKLLEHTSVWEFESGGNPKPEHTSEKTMPSDAPFEEDTSSNTKGSDTMTRNNNQATVIKVIRDKLEGLVKTLAVDDTAQKEEGKGETPLLLAAKYGVTEMVDKIINKFPMAICDSDSDKKNVVLLAVENRQPHVYNFLLKSTFQKERIFSELDNRGNSALHLAATQGKLKPWRTPGAAFHMQWELKWYKFVKYSMPRQYFVRYNTKGVTPKEVFNETHKDLVKEGGQWLTNTSQSCSVVAALIATVAFATSSTVPGGVKQDGTPTLQGHPAFNVFAISSLVALCFSVISLVMFLAILTSRYQEKDFARDLPIKLIIGLSSLFISISAILVSFCSGDFFVVKDNLKAYPVYAVTCLPVMFFAAAQFPLYVDLIKSTFNKVPQLSSK